MKYFKVILFFFLLISLQGFAQQELQFADALQSSMVLQQNKPFKVWGKATAGKTVIVKADWLKTAISVVADQANDFLAIIPMPSIQQNDFSKHSMSIESDGEQRTLTNLLIGDVWFCSGQSNMQFSMSQVRDSALENSRANYPNIRLLNADLNLSASQLTNFKGKWETCSPQTVLKFSAVGYNFGKTLFDSLHIPIGLIFSGIGASAAQAFVPQADLAADTMLDRVYLQPYLTSDKSKEVINGGFSFEKVTRPFLLYNAMIHPFINLSVKGFCWYQGETNRKERESYTRLTQQLIKSWRKKFSQGELPFYYVQIAPYNYDKLDSTLAGDAYFREAQENISKLNNTAMVVTMDVGDASDLHPKNKKPIGIRLAKAALHRDYARLNVQYRGPEFESMEIIKNKVIVSFKDETIGAGLTTNNGLAPAYFAVAGSNKVFYPATATIVGNNVVLNSREVKKPVAVRYAFTNYPVTNFENKDGLPALPFRTDNWPEVIAK